MSVLKQLLAVPRNTTNISILLELGRYPLTISMQHQAIKYFLRFPHINKDRLLFKMYKENQQTYNVNTNFVSYIIQILNSIGMSDIWITQLLNQEHNEPKNKSFIQEILSRLKDI